MCRDALPEMLETWHRFSHWVSRTNNTRYPSMNNSRVDGKEEGAGEKTVSVPLVE